MFKDAFGRPLKQGDYITYGKSFGRSAGLGIGRVLAVRETVGEKLVSRDPWEYGVVPLGKYVLDVITLQGWNPITAPDHSAQVRLLYEDRVLRINAQDIPDKIRPILNRAYFEFLKKNIPTSTCT